MAALPVSIYQCGKLLQTIAINTNSSYAQSIIIAICMYYCINLIILMIKI